MSLIDAPFIIENVKHDYTNFGDVKTRSALS
jgi:hypothetical protein